MENKLKTAYETLKCSESDTLEEITEKYNAFSEQRRNSVLFTEAYNTIKEAKLKEAIIAADKIKEDILEEPNISGKEDFEYDMVFANMANDQYKELKRQEKEQQEILVKLEERRKRKGIIRKFVDSFKVNKKNK